MWYQFLHIVTSDQVSITHTKRKANAVPASTPQSSESLAIGDDAASLLLPKSTKRGTKRKADAVPVSIRQFSANGPSSKPSSVKESSISCGTLYQSSSNMADVLSESFENYKRCFHKWTVTIVKNQNVFYESKCNCPAFLKEYICKHVVGLAIRLKLVSVPPEAKTVPIGQKRKRGRPSKTKPALMIQ